MRPHSIRILSIEMIVSFGIHYHGNLIGISGTGAGECRLLDPWHIPFQSSNKIGAALPFDLRPLRESCCAARLMKGHVAAILVAQFLVRQIHVIQRIGKTVMRIHGPNGLIVFLFANGGLGARQRCLYRTESPVERTECLAFEGLTFTFWIALTARSHSLLIG